MANDNDGMNHVAHVLGVGLLVVLIGFAFGRGAARVFVATVLGIATLAFLYVFVRVVMGDI